MSIPRRKLSLFEVLVIFILIVLLLLLIQPVREKRREWQIASMRDQGVNLYKAIYSYGILPYFNEREFDFHHPASTNFTNSTEYFRRLVTENILDTEFGVFGGFGQKRTHTKIASHFTSENNAWNVVLDLANSDSQTPLLFTRNFLHADTRLPTQSEASIADKLGEPENTPGKLSFNADAVVVINKIGSGQVLKHSDLKAAKNFNPTDSDNLFLKP